MTVPGATTTPGCPVTLDKTTLSVGQAEANWVVYVTTAPDCAWSVATDVNWLVVKSTAPPTAVGSGYAKVRAIANNVSPSKRTGRFAINGIVHTVSQGGCSAACTPTPIAKLRVLQYNTHHGGWGSDGAYSPERIVDWIAKSDADLVSLNEIEMRDSWSKNQDQSAIYQDLLQQRTGRRRYKIFVNAHGGRPASATSCFRKFRLSRRPPIS